MNGQPQVQLLPSDLGLPICSIDLRDTVDPEDQLKQLCAEEFQAPFDLAQGPLVRAKLINL
ncbi:hypothetical protein BGZ79_006134, partial [Entomortierella chlamydospora]